MYENFTDRALKVVQLARLTAWRADEKEVTTLNILEALLKEGSNETLSIFENFGVNLQELSSKFSHPPKDPAENTNPSDLPLTQDATNALEFATREAMGGKVGVDHILLGLLSQGGIASIILYQAGLTFNKVKQKMLHIWRAQGLPPEAFILIEVPQNDIKAAVEHLYRAANDDPRTPVLAHFRDLWLAARPGDRMDYIRMPYTHCRRGDVAYKLVEHYVEREGISLSYRLHEKITELAEQIGISKEEIIDLLRPIVERLFKANFPS